MKKVMAILITLLLACCVYSPICLAENENPSSENMGNIPDSGGLTNSKEPQDGKVTDGAVTDGKATDGKVTDGGVTDDEATNDEATGGKVTDDEVTNDEDSGKTIIEVNTGEFKNEKPKVILIKKIGGKWEHESNIDSLTINIGWILLAFVSVISLVINCTIIFNRRGR